MKKDRLLEIIREEISAALREGEAEEKAAKAAAIKATDLEIAALQKKKAEMMKTGVAEVALEEDTLNERPFIDSAFDITGTSPENFNQDSLQNAIDDAVKVLQKENPDADVKKLAGELQKVNSVKNLGPKSKLSPELKNALQKVANIIEKQGEIFGNKSKIDDLIKLAKDPSQIDRLEKLKLKGYTFILGNAQAVTAIEKSLGLKPKNNDSLLADKTKSTEKPKAEKPAKEKTPKAEKTPKTRVATRTKGDDGFDTVSYVDKEEAKAAAAAEKADKALGGKYAANLSSEDESNYESYKSDITSLVNDLENKYDKSKMEELKLYLEDSEVRRLFKAKGVKLSDLVRSVIK